MAIDGTYRVWPRDAWRIRHEYVNEQGALVRASARSKTEAERLETFFANHNIPVKIEKAR